MKKYSRECSYCGRIKFYKTSEGMERAKTRNSRCSSCCQDGKLNPFYGKTHTKEWIRHLRENGPSKNPEVGMKISKSLTGRSLTEDHKKKVKIGVIKFRQETQDKVEMMNKKKLEVMQSKEYRESASIKSKLQWERQRVNGYVKPIVTDETRRKQSVSGRIRRIRELNERGINAPMNYNRSSISIIEQYGKEHGYNFQHAENGGEYHIKELGYFVDGYDREKNVVIEYYEKAHNRTKERDERRKQEIIDHLDCKFIEIKE